jgi:hypothetical protein
VYLSSCSDVNWTGFSRAMVVFRRMTESGISGVSSAVLAPPWPVLLMLMDGRP